MAGPGDDVLAWACRALGTAARAVEVVSLAQAADLDGTGSGRLALLTTVLEGSSRIPTVADAERLRRLGRECAEIGRAAVDPHAALPPRERSLAGVPFETLAAPERSAALLTRARRVLDEAAPPDEPHGFVHGDLWQGNTFWGERGYAGAVDWDFAGVGPAGIDLGSLRCDVAVMYGGDAPDLVLEGWHANAPGTDVHVAWWDLVAGSSTPPDLSSWVPNFHAQGRTDLDLGTVTARRDAFLEPPSARSRERRATGGARRRVAPGHRRATAQSSMCDRVVGARPRARNPGTIVSSAWRVW